jgi:hypothetical protein
MIKPTPNPPETERALDHYLRTPCCRPRNAERCWGLRN